MIPNTLTLKSPPPLFCHCNEIIFERLIQIKAPRFEVLRCFSAPDLIDCPLRYGFLIPKPGEVVLIGD